MLKATAALGAAFLCLLLSAPAAARQVPCGERAAIMTRLAAGYGERPVAMALDARGRVLEVLAAPSGTWTMLVSTPGGMNCLIASGIAWEPLTPLGDPS
ncbi:MAG: hypothetical protein V3R98_13865 [Alphaproteobacteria bacterium]